MNQKNTTFLFPAVKKVVEMENKAGDDISEIPPIMTESLHGYIFLTPPTHLAFLVPKHNIPLFGIRVYSALFVSVTGSCSSPGSSQCVAAKPDCKGPGYGPRWAQLSAWTDE